MAIGMIPKYKTEMPIGNLSADQFIILGLEAAMSLKWMILYMSEEGMVINTNRGHRVWNAELKITIRNGVVTIVSTSLANEFTDWGKNKKNVQDFITALKEKEAILSVEEMAMRWQQLRDYGHIRYDGYLSANPPAPAGIGHDFISLIKPTGDYFITPLLLDINLLLFALMAFTGVNIMLPDSVSLLHWGANYRPLTMDGEIWRLLTNCFLHIGVIHLLMNMYALFFIGLLLEPYMGKARFLTAYLLTGIAGSVVSLWWHDMNIISAGASGAIFGLYGVFLALLTTNIVAHAQRKALLFSIVFFVGYNLANGLKEGIDNAAHIGGLVSGIVIGYLFIPSLRKPDSAKLKLITILIATALLMLSSAFIYKATSKDMITYEQQMKQFVKKEQMALALYSFPPSTPPATMIAELNDHGIIYWQENLRLLEGLNKLKLPLEVQSRNSKLGRYCSLRIQSYKTLEQYLESNNDLKKKEVDTYNLRIQSLLDSLNRQPE